MAYIKAPISPTFSRNTCEQIPYSTSILNSCFSHSEQKYRYVILSYSYISTYFSPNKQIKQEKNGISRNSHWWGFPMISNFFLSVQSLAPCIIAQCTWILLIPNIHHCTWILLIPNMHHCTWILIIPNMHHCTMHMNTHYS